MLRTFLDPNIGVPESLLVSLLAILIVFGVLALIIGATTGIQAINDKINYVTKINPSPENKILEEDKDAVVATLVATIDYQREFNTDVKVNSVELIDEE
ncbi:MAG: OadG family protein [Bacilli bacterium]|nr:OadG family protein [Bacilli bacterium]